jgi:hypothetical protein
VRLKRRRNHSLTDALITAKAGAGCDAPSQSAMSGECLMRVVTEGLDISGDLQLGLLKRGISK